MTSPITGNTPIDSTVFEIDSTVSEFVVPLNEIAAMQNGRRLRLDAVRSIMFFMIDTDGSEKIIIHDIRLVTY